jgi:hypothetical protein
MDWHEPFRFPSTAIGDPRLKPRHLSLLAALHYLACRDFYFDLQIPNSDLMVLARFGDHQTLYRYRSDLDRIGYLSFFSWTGFATEYDLDRGDLSVPVGLLADRRITTPGAIALYLALTALASRTKASNELYGTSCMANNQQLQDAARFSGPAQLRRHRKELTDANLLVVTPHQSKPPAYELTLNQGANTHLQAELATL